MGNNGAYSREEDREEFELGELDRPGEGTNDESHRAEQNNL